MKKLTVLLLNSRDIRGKIPTADWAAADLILAPWAPDGIPTNVLKVLKNRKGSSRLSCVIRSTLQQLGLIGRR
jgi:hypothetical protein